MAAALNIGLAPIWPLSVDRYHAMIEAGILGPDDRVELLDGVIVEKMSNNPPHAFTTWAARAALAEVLPAGWYVAEQGPITLSSSEPEPDTSVVRGKRRDYVKRYPGAGDLAMVVEVADSSLKRDRVLKKRIYARAGIPVYWIIDLNARQVEIFSQPGDDEYATSTVYREPDSLPVVLDGQVVGSIRVTDLLP